MVVEGGYKKEHKTSMSTTWDDSFLEKWIPNYWGLRQTSLNAQRINKRVLSRHTMAYWHQWPNWNSWNWNIKTLHSCCWCYKEIEMKSTPKHDSSISREQKMQLTCFHSSRKNKSDLPSLIWLFPVSFSLRWNQISKSVLIGVIILNFQQQLVTFANQIPGNKDLA